MADRTMSQFLFGQSEHPSRQKMNDLVSIVDRTRTFVGDISTSLLTSGHTASGVYMVLAESPYLLGGVVYDATISTWTTRNAFWIGYDATVYSGLGTGDVADYATWDSVLFISGTASGVSGYWYSFLSNTGDMVTGYGNFTGPWPLGTGASEVNLSGATISSFNCINKGPWES